MRDALGPGTFLGYCTNVHAGATCAAMQANLQRHALAVKRRVSPGGPLGVGLWLSAAAARQLVAENRAPALRDWLSERGLTVFTLNGFPYGDFHQAVVKHDVYQPDWTDPRRVAYTRDLVAVLAVLLPEAAEGSISTLPLGWGPGFTAAPARWKQAAANLTDLVHYLARVELDTGKLIHLDLEPEPGCALERSGDVVRFFTEHLLGTPDDLSVRSYLRVCHDVCHAAVMFEDQAQALAKYRAAGLKVGKVQVSNAARAAATGTALAELARLVEDRYLHQTVVRRADGGTIFYDDLPQALAAARGEELPGEWRVHFHVPIYLERFGALCTTRDDIGRCLAALGPGDGVHHFEVETYAWDVLPDELKHDELAAGIAAELQWLTKR